MKLSPAFLAMLATGCSTLTDTAKDYIKGPQVSAPGASKDAIPPAAEQRLALGQEPARPISENPENGSLWRDGPTSLFGDRRARTRGDILTVVIQIDDRADIQNQTTRSRSAAEGLQIPNLFGLQTLATKILPGASNLDPAINASSSSSSAGQGQIRRQDRITLQVAATVVNVLPNGQLVIAGSQEIRVNQELRDLQVSGIVRPEDVSRRNTITYEKIADARIIYGGRGTLSNAQDAHYGQKVINTISPF